VGGRKPTAGVAEVGVDGLEDGPRASRSEHPPELAERLRLVRDEDQDRAGGDRVHAAAGQPSEVVCGRAQEPAACGHAKLGRRMPTGIEQVLGDIAEDHLWLAALESAEGDQPVAATHVEQPVIAPEPGAVEDPVPDRMELLSDPLGNLGVIPDLRSSSQLAQMSRVMPEMLHRTPSRRKGQEATMVLMSVNVTPSGTHGQRPPPGPLKNALFWFMRTSHRLGARRMDGMPVVLVITRGARSGEQRATPVMCFPEGDSAWLVVASFGGSARHPAWFVNMARHPDEVWVEVDG